MSNQGKYREGETKRGGNERRKGERNRRRDKWRQGASEEVRERGREGCRQEGKGRTTWVWVRCEMRQIDIAVVEYDLKLRDGPHRHEFAAGEEMGQNRVKFE